MTEGINVGDKLYHLTSDRALESIEREGLIPHSLFSALLYRGSKKYKNEYYYASYFTVCGVKEQFVDWKEYGLFEDLFERMQERSSSGKVVLLSFPIETDDSVFVADHSHLSPKRFKELYGEDLWRMPGLVSLNRGQSIRLNKHGGLYTDSLTKLQDYDGSFELPEVWYPHKVPVEQITLEEVLE